MAVTVPEDAVTSPPLATGVSLAGGAYVSPESASFNVANDADQINMETCTGSAKIISQCRQAWPMD